MDNNERLGLLHEGIIFAETIGIMKCQIDTVDARFLYDMASRADLAPQWQPIESAPRDGTIIDVWVPGHGRECDVWYDDGWSFPVIPTHWMPIPAPPKEAA